MPGAGPGFDQHGIDMPLQILGRGEQRGGIEIALHGFAGTENVASGTERRAPVDAGNVDLAAQIASIPEQIRGYGHVKEDHLAKAKAREAELLCEWENPLRLVRVA